MGEHLQPRIAVVGPGALGCLFASVLSQAGYAIRLLDKRPERAHLLSERGIHVETHGVVQRFELPVLAAPEDDPCDVLLLCVKAFDTAGASRYSLPLVDERTTVVSLQNGLGNLEAIAENTAPGQVVCAVTGHGATTLAPGSVRHAGAGITRVAPFVVEGMPHAIRVEHLFRSAGFDVECLVDVDSVRWSKLVVNAAINALSAIHNVPNGRLTEDPALRDDMRRAAKEAERVALGRGIQLLYPDGADQAEAVCRQTGDNLSSMLQDVRARKPTEIDAVNGAIVRHGTELGIPVPVNADLVERIREIENTY